MLNTIRIVTVTFNSAAVIRNFLESVPGDVEVVVVDNNSADTTREIVAEFDVQLVALPENAGFGTGCNAGAKGNDKPFVFFVNPDSVLTAECCEKLLEAAAKHPETAAFNPAILNENGQIRLNRRSSLIPKSEWTDRSFARADGPQSGKVSILSGAALFCRQPAFDAIGGFDERIFLYHEDDDLCLRLRQAGWALRLDHRASVKHIGGASSGAATTGTRIKAHAIAQSRLYVERKHDKSVPALRGWLRAIGKLISPLNLLSARKRAQATAFWRGTVEFDAERYGKRDC